MGVATSDIFLMYGKMYISFYLEAFIDCHLFKYFLFSLNGMHEEML